MKKWGIYNISQVAVGLTLLFSFSAWGAVGNISATLKNVNGSNAPASGTRFILYTSPSQNKSGSNPASFTGVTTGTYWLEGYCTGTFWGEEFWTSQQVTVTSGQTTNATLTRIYGFANQVKVYNNSTNVEITAGQQIIAGTTVRAEVTVQNNVPGTALNSKVHFVFDMSRSSPYDNDQTSAVQSISGSGGTKKYTFTYTPITTGQYYYALEVLTTLSNGNTVRTDSWGWSQTFIVQPSVGNVNATLKNVNGSNTSGSGTKFVLYTSPMQTKTGSNPASFTNISPGSYTLEGYYTATFWGEEYWASGQFQVNAGSTTDATLTRNYPFANQVKVYNNSTNAEITAGQQIIVGTTVRAEVTVQNNVPGTALNSKVHFVFDMSQSSPYDNDQTSASQTISGSGGTKKYTFTYTPNTTGQYYFSLEVLTTLANGNTVRTDSWGWIQTFNVQNGNLIVTAKNIGGNGVSGAVVKRYDSSWGYIDQKTTDGSGNATWNSIPSGTYNLEAYYTGTFLGQEYWASDSAVVTAGTTTNKTLQRNYPYAENIVFKNNATEEIINSSSVINPGTTVRAEITVRNNVSSSLGVSVHLLLDRDQSSPYDSDQTSPEQTVSSGGTKIFILTYTPTQPGAWYSAFEIKTKLANLNIVTTDAWGWSQRFECFASNGVDLVSFSFSKGVYRKYEKIYVAVQLRNSNPAALINVHLRFDFRDPSGSYVGGTDSGVFTISALSDYQSSGIEVWEVSGTSLSGAYELRMRLLGSSGQEYAFFMPDNSTEIPILPIGQFPRLNNLIVRSQEHFSSSDSSSVASVLQEFVNRRFHSLSMSVKLDDGSGLWSSLNPIPGQVLFDSDAATVTASNPLPYDLYLQAQNFAVQKGLNINPWIPTFYDHAQSRYDHPEWRLLNDPVNSPNQDFVDAYIKAVRDYESGLVAELLSKYSAPRRMTLDHFRFTNGQHGSDGATSITQYIQIVKNLLPVSSKLAGYTWLPSDTWWSGQDYSLLSPYLDVFSPMLYWQSKNLNSTDNVPYAARQYIKNKIAEIRNVLGSTVTAEKVQPTVGITFATEFSDGGQRDLTYYEWEKTQLNVLGAMADEGLSSYDLFYHGYWLWYVYPEDTAKGRWIDWAKYLANLSDDLKADVTGDGHVNTDDLYQLAENWLWTGTPGSIYADIAPYPNGDGIVNFLDFALMAENWMK